MADGDIKQRIVLTGEKEYSAALKEAQRNLKTLRSELKAETAELGANATAQQKNEVKVKNLQKQIKEQEKVVRTYKAALDEVKEKYSDNEDAIAKWEQKLNDARATLANMKNGLQDVGNGMQSIEGNMERGVVAANSFADSLGKIAGVGDTISGAIESSFTTIVGHITDAVSALWDQLMDVAARANEWGDIAGYWNTSASNIQKWYHAVEGTYNEFSSLSSAVTKIVTADQKKVAEVAGVSAEQYSDKWEYAMAVMDSLSKMGYEKKLEAVGELFGDKRSPIILDLLNDWDKIQKNLADFDATNGGFGLTDEQLEKASTLAEDVAKLKESWQALQDMATISLFGDLALNITGNLQNIVEAFKEYFQAENDEQKQAALQKVKDNIIEIFKNIRDAINDGLKLLDDLAEELKNSDDATARALGEALDKIVGALEWVADPANWNAVKKGFDAIIGVWAAGKIVSAVGYISSFAANLLTISRFTGGGGPTVNPTTGGEPTVTNNGSGGGRFIAVLKSAAAVLTFAKVLTDTDGLVAQLYGGPAQAEGIYNAAGELEESAKQLGFFVNENGELERDTSKINPEMVNEYGYIPELVMKDPLSEMTAEQWEAAQKWWDIYRSNPYDFSDEAWDEYVHAFEGQDELFAELERKMDEIVQSVEDDSWTGMEDLPAEWWNGGGTDNGLTSEDISGFRSVPGQMRAAVREGISGIRVTMDGYTVGNLVAPYVSQYIARDIVG